jgi:hypothetical protein
LYTLGRRLQRENRRKRSKEKQEIERRNGGMGKENPNTRWRMRGERE